jgi:TonB family protein
MSTSETVMEFPTMPTSAPGSGLFASYELKPDRRPGAIFAGYGIQGIIVLLLLTLTFTTAPVLLPKKYSTVSLVAPTEPPPVHQPRTQMTLPTPRVALPSPALPEAPSPMRIQAPQMPHAERPVAMPAPAAPRPALQPANVLATLPAMPVAAPKPIHTGAFGDPSGVPAQPSSMPTRGPEVAAVGSFASPGTVGRPVAYGVATGAFGAPEGVPGGRGTSTGGHGVVPGAFGSPEGSAVVAQAKAMKGVDFSEPAMAKAQPTAVKVAALAPVAILSKPAPIYTEEARRLHVEGSVTLNVVFAASGEVHIVGVVKGLGHGLDEAATAAARQIRFTPARREGQSVDYPATIHIVFALS